MAVGPDRWMCSACRRVATPTRWPPRRSGNWPTSMASASRCWCGCGVTVASMLIRRQWPGPRWGGRARTARSSPAPNVGTWWTPTDQHAEEHAQYGRVRVRAWAGVHAKTQNHPAKGSYRPKGIVRGTLVLVEVERLPRQTRIPERLWLWWRGPDHPA